MSHKRGFLKLAIPKSRCGKLLTEVCAPWDTDARVGRIILAY
jgi:hypothetical protein